MSEGNTQVTSTLSECAALNLGAQRIWRAVGFILHHDCDSMPAGNLVTVPTGNEDGIQLDDKHRTSSQS